MAKKKSAPKGMTKSQKVGLGVGLTATALAAAGGYFLYGSKDAGKNRKQVKSWMLKAKAEVLEGIETAKHMTKDEYEELVDDVVKGYKKAKGASAKELVEFGKEMHGKWKELERSAAKRTKKVARGVAKRAAKVAKK